jgi:hypothetical protein
VDKNEFRYIKETDTIEGYKWYHEMIDFVKSEVKALMECIK